MTGSVARHCEPPHNWRPDSDPRGWRRGEPQLLNGPVTSRMISTAVVRNGVRHRLPERPVGCFAQSVPDPFSHDTARRVSDSSKSTLREAERRQMFEATPRRSRIHTRETTGRLQFRNSSNPNPRYPNSPTGNQGSRSSTFRGKKRPSKKFCETSPRYRYVLLDIQGHTDGD